MLQRSIKLLVSLFLFPVYFIIDAMRGVNACASRRNVVVLYYHAIPASERLKFARQMDILLRWATPIRADFKSFPPGRTRLAAVTFDDGFVSFAQSALPELEKRKIPAALFVVTENLGRFPEWAEHTAPDSPCGEPLLTAAELRKIPDLVTIGSHTLTHPNLTHVSESEAKRQLMQSRLRLEQMLGRKVTLFSFPHGAFNDELIHLSRQAGYERVFTILPTPAASSDFVVGRVWANPTDWPLEFLLKLLGAYRWLPIAFGLKRKLLAALKRITASQKRRYRERSRAA